MSRPCREFRERLAGVLSGGNRAERADLTALSWHEHLLGCADCRSLLDAEEALEALLATLPEPVLPPLLVERVLARLENARIDELLELDRAGALEVPADLASDVLAALRPHREQRASESAEAALDRLLERVPAPAPPAGLADGVLRGLEAQRTRRGPTALPGTPAAPASVRRGRPSFGWSLGLVAALLLAFGWAAWLLRAAREGRGGAPDGRGLDSVTVAQVDEVVPEELLASLELLESWDVLAGDDLDLALAALDDVDLLILELEAEGS